MCAVCAGVCVCVVCVCLCVCTCVCVAGQSDWVASDVRAWCLRSSAKCAVIKGMSAPPHNPEDVHTHSRTHTDAHVHAHTYTRTPLRLLDPGLPLVLLLLLFLLLLLLLLPTPRFSRSCTSLTACRTLKRSTQRRSTSRCSILSPKKRWVRGGVQAHTYAAKTHSARVFDPVAREGVGG